MYIYINMYTCIARFPEQLHRRWVPIALWDFLQRWTATTSPSWADDGSQKWLARLSYNDWSLYSASVNQIQSLCLFSNKSLSGNAFTLKDLSLLLLQRSQFRPEIMCHCLQKIACAVLIPCDVQSLWKWPPTIKACNGTWSRLVCSRWWPCPVGCNFKVLMAASPESVLWECFDNK